MKHDIKAITLNGNQKLEDIIIYRSTDNDDVFYQESVVPFFVMLMSVNSKCLEKSIVSLVTPESELIIPVSSLTTGRGRASLHQHNCFEFTYVLEGSMYQIVEGKRYFYPTGSCCLMNRNTLHAEEVSSDYSCIFLSITPEFVQRMIGDSRFLLFPGEKKNYDNLIFDFLRCNTGDSELDSKDFLDFIPMITQTEQVKLVHQIFEDLMQTLVTPDFGASFRVYELLIRLIGILCDKNCYHAEHVTARSNMDSILFSRIDKVLSEHKGRITNTELAQLLNYNGSYLGRIVKKYTGMSLFDYSMTFTMKEAADLLLDGSLTTSEIAARLRFTNLTHFYKLFKEFYGLTPKEYRNKNLAGS